ncbi:hypothetical protein GCM10007380_15190 [Gottfriedia solisilvae]|uniref:Uncharacterized protein n=1 Tax=Gottfriedia solisilvae TaxID=1516104 RepID=A0A8J3AGH3_9BACI|nr:hypothetical protein GCM10007380_15190 [Gottfriedia solisilvae]
MKRIIVRVLLSLISIYLLLFIAYRPFEFLGILYNIWKFLLNGK